MALGPRLDIRQSQSLVMTPQLQQAIKLLALSNLEIETYIAEELEKNPLLDARRDGDENTPAELPDFTDDYVSDSDNGDFEVDPITTDQLLHNGDAQSDAPLDVDFGAETYHHDSAADAAGQNGAPGMDGSLGLSGSNGAGYGEDGSDFDSMASAALSLHDHLLAQAGTILSGDDFLIAAHIIDLIDEAGYLTAPIFEIATRLETPLHRIEAVLKAIQSCDPTGVGARSLAECLALQAKEADRYDPCMERLLANLDLLANGRLPQLKRICGVDDEDLADMIRELRDYDPKPGLRFGAEIVQSVVPDIFIAQRSTGWAIEINTATLPRLLVNRSYYVELSGGKQDKASKAWLSDCLASANWLVKALDQRQRTIIKVATELVKQQQAFFSHGVAYLKPLTLKAVADAIGMHESTVSRVTSNKYLSCARGLYELKYFFTSGIQSSDGGDAVSAEAVKSHIKALITAEDPKKILSDDTLVELLRAKGFDIARRTVAKYREALGIGSSVQRRRQKALGG